MKRKMTRLARAGSMVRLTERPGWECEVPVALRRSAEAWRLSASDPKPQPADWRRELATKTGVDHGFADQSQVAEVEAGEEGLDRRAVHASGLSFAGGAVCIRRGRIGGAGALGFGGGDGGGCVLVGAGDALCIGGAGAGEQSGAQCVSGLGPDERAVHQEERLGGDGWWRGACRRRGSGRRQSKTVEEVGDGCCGRRGT